MVAWSPGMSLLDPAYSKTVLDAVQAKDFDHAWAHLHAGPIELLVSSDALKMGGVRINVSATLQQTIADWLGAILPTPKIMDLRWLARSASFPPAIYPIAANTDTMIAASASLDSRIAAATSAITKLGGALGGNTIYASQKTWAIGNSLAQHQGRAMNYGFFVIPNQGTAYSGIATEACVSITDPKQGRVIQGQGWAHDVSHSDYSQCAFFVHRRCKVGGADRDVLDVLKDSTLASYLSHEGPLQVTRQPGVAVACPFPGTLGRIPGEMVLSIQRRSDFLGQCSDVLPAWPSDVQTEHPWVRAGIVAGGLAAVTAGGVWAAKKYL